VLTPDGIHRSLRRISHEILERNASQLDGLALVGVLTRGVPLARRISENIKQFEGIDVPVGSLDITLHRDDLADEDQHLRGSDALLELGRPAAIRLAILVDRGHRELPIRADYVGKNVPTAREDRVLVSLLETDGEDGVVVVGD
jgi:pyrimidine operon attenuation protein/uracil phosphoribosyltransferase